MASSDWANGSGGRDSISESKIKVLCYDIETVSDDLIDCRLQIRAPDALKPQWYEKRCLTQRDEIVDKLLDARTGRIAWTSHRPNRGWYLHLQLPSLPRDKAIPLLPAESMQPGCTPLSFSIGTRIDITALSRVDNIISQSTIGKDDIQEQLPLEDSQFIAVSLDHTEDTPPSIKTTSHARTSSRNVKQGHARRRSARMSAGTSNSRHVSRSSQVENLPESQNGSEDGKIQGTEVERPRLPLLDISSQPQLCHFILTDDVKAREPQATDTWSRWAWKSVPVSLRTPLTLTSSVKSFSLLWVNAPLSTRANSTVEVVRYQDDAGWWNWKSKRKGTILIQEQAVKALRLDTSLWIAVTLAYLKLLEERDGYHASSDG